MTTKISKINVVFLSVLASLLASSCASLTEAECDPSDSAFLKTFQCQGQYANRSEKLKEEVRAAADRTNQQEQKLTEIEARKFALQQKLDELQSDLDASRQRIALLKKENKASEGQLNEVEARLETVQKESENLKERHAEMQAMAQAGALDEQLAQLQAEEAELEALLLDLES